MTWIFPNIYIMFTHIRVIRPPYPQVLTSKWSTNCVHSTDQPWSSSSSPGHTVCGRQKGTCSACPSPGWMKQDLVQGGSTVLWVWTCLAAGMATGGHDEGNAIFIMRKLKRALSWCQSSAEFGPDAWYGQTSFCPTVLCLKLVKNAAGWRGNTIC